MTKVRLDQLLVNRGLCESREKARRLIMTGDVLVDDVPHTKPGHQVKADVNLRVRATPPYVSRGGLKLASALDKFDIRPQDYVCADFGASTGGFTDVLLQRQARKVYAVDVGYGQLHWTLRQDSRVVVMERTNARYLQHLPEPIDLVTIDAAFISLRLLLGPAQALLQPQGQIICLIKPQFEAGKESVGKGGVIRDEAVHMQVLDTVLTFAQDHGLSPQGLHPSPVLGPKGNKEFLLWLYPISSPADRMQLINDAMRPTSS